MGHKPTPYEVFTKTHGVFDAESGSSQWSNTKSERVHVIFLTHVFFILLLLSIHYFAIYNGFFFQAEYRALLDEHPTRDPNQMWLDAVNNVEAGTKKKSNKSLFIGSASQIIYPSEPINYPSCESELKAALEEKFKELEARQQTFNARLEEAVRTGNDLNAYEIYQRLSNQIYVERECFRKLLNDYNIQVPFPPNQ